MTSAPSHTVSIDTLHDVVETVLNDARTMSVADRATVIALSGDLGAGKTTFVQHLAKALGVNETVNSPTFVIMKSYDTADETFTHLFHIDAYRIEDPSEMTPLRFSELQSTPGALICIEWAERIRSLISVPTIELSFRVADEDHRTIMYEKNSDN